MSNSLKITFKPQDTLFFRDGSPFNREELQANVGSIFPPSPTTLAGAIRAAWAKSLGWNGKGAWDINDNWDETCKDTLGAGKELAEIKFDGPYLFMNDSPIFPAPAHLLGKPPVDPKARDVEAPCDLILLQPEKTFKTDICSEEGSVFLATVPEENEDDTEKKAVEGRKALIDEWWITTAGMNQVLQGNIPEQDTLIHQSKLWTIEHRIGNYRKEKRITKLNALYAPKHIRLADNVSLVMFAQNLPDDKLEKIMQQPAPTGGEARSCWLSIEKDKSISDYLKPDQQGSDTDYVLIALTPLQLKNGLQPDMQVDAGHLQTACNKRAIMLGGWDKNKPRALVPHLPAGSVLFMQAESPQNNFESRELGNNPQWGFGKFITGTRN